MSADLVVRGGRIFTADPSRPFVSAVAAVGERISALEGDAEGSIGPTTRVIDLKGALATPGFIDAHVHPATSGLDKLRCHFDGCDDAASALARITEYARAHPEAPWILGAGWQQSWYDRGCPTREILDAVIPDRPALLWNTDGHGAWANTRALETAGVTASTLDPPDGRIERLEDGTPQGTLHEGAARLVERHAPEDTVEELTDGLLRGQEELLGHGITGWQDAMVDEKVHEAYLRLAGDGRLRGRVVGAMWWHRDGGLEQIHHLVARREQTAPGFAPTSVKLMLDGVAENFTAAMLQPYLTEGGESADNTGIDFIEPEDLRQIVAFLDDHDFQCHFHAIGDRAVRNALDAVEWARQRNGSSDNRHHIAHLQVVDPDDIPRFGRLGVVANAQPLWAHNDAYQTDLTQPFLGEERSGLQYPFGALLAAGARLAMGSDWGVSSCNVMEEIQVAVSRSWDDGEEPLGPDQALNPLQALTAFTAGSAYVNHADERSGTIAEGNLADLTVLDRDPLREGPFRETRVVATIIGGEVVFEEG